MCRNSLFDQFHPRAEYIWELESLEELIQVLDVYDIKTTLKLEEEYQRLVKELKKNREQYEEELKKWEERIEKELKADPVYKKLLCFLSDSAYGMRIRYGIDPYNGFFGGSGIRPWEITKVFYEGLKELGLLKS